MKTNQMTLNVFCIMIFLLLFFSLETQAQSNNIYAYIAQESSGEIKIKGINPLNPSYSTDISTIIVSNDFRMEDALLSPNGQWVVLILSSGNQQTIRVVNINTNEIRNLNGIVFPPPDTLMEKRSQIIWSPDSRYFAFNSFSQNDQRDTYLYSIAGSNLINLASDSANQYQFVWSKDSTKIASISGECNSSSTNCNNIIRIFDPITNTLNQSINLSTLQNLPGANLICNLDWSPDKRFLTFMVDCDTTGLTSLKEMFLVDTTTSSITAITNYTTLMNPSDPFALRFAYYSPVWFNSQLLLTGAIYADANTQGTQTFSFNPLTGNKTILSSEIIEEWEINPISSEIAFRTSTINSPNLERQNSVIKIATLNNSILSVNYTVNPGCDLNWSPDGNILAYADRGFPFNSCTEQVRKLIFVNRLSGITQEYNPTEIIIPLGWVNVISQPLITNISVTGSSRTYTRQPNLAVGSTAYTDRVYTYKTVPSQYLGSEYIQTANDDKQTNPFTLNFTLTAPAREPSG